MRLESHVAPANSKAPAVVIGAGSGIGRATASPLAKHDYPLGERSL